MIDSPFPRACLVACFSAAMLSGCSLWPQNADSRRPSSTVQAEGSVESAALVAQDFVQALRQIPSLHPAETTISLLENFRSDDFTQAIRAGLDESGYAVRWVIDTGSNHLLLYRREQEASHAGVDRVRFDVAVGQVELRRTYLKTAQDRFKPVTPLYVKGADASAVVLNDQAFLASTPQSTAATTSALAVPDDANPLMPLVPRSVAAKSLTLPLIALPEVQNVFELGGSNYRNALASHQIVVEQILTFPNDSLRLGKTNKQLIEQMVERFDPITDLFSVIGCSLGPTRVKGGNAALALGRASRVREALLFAGVSQARILDEGCWAGDSADNTLPPRGVVITLNRQS